MEQEERKDWRVVIATDKFKGSMSSLQAAGAIRRGMLRALEKNHFKEGENWHFDMVEIADGGDGSAGVVRALLDKETVQEVKCRAVNPVGKEIETSFLLYSLKDAIGREERCAFIEMARVSGLELIPVSERNPLHTTTYGLGQLVLRAYECGVEKITLSIGGSATNDGGTGMLQALGFRFYNKQGAPVTEYMCGGRLEEISKIEYPDGGEDRILAGFRDSCRVEVVCDVTNPLLGENGATNVYGPQKGATLPELEILERGMRNFSEVAERANRVGGQIRPEYELPGTGAAGGVGYAVKRFLRGEISSGWRFFASLTGLEKRIREADLVISGEGRIDSQSFSGKVIDGVLTLAEKYEKEVWLFCGINELQTLPWGDKKLSGCRIFELRVLEPDKAASMQNGEKLLEKLAGKVWTEYLGLK